jgi:hypothetical protein
MSVRYLVRRIALGCLGGALLLAMGCQGPLAPTPEHGKAFEPNKAAMIQNPDAPEEYAEGLDPATAKVVIENYDRNQKVENQERRHRNQARGIDVEY